MQNARFVPMETIPMTISSSSAACVTSVCIRDVSGWQRCLPRVGCAKFAQLLVLEESTCLVLFVMSKEEP